MNAKEARELTEKHTVTNVDQYIKHIDARIKEMAKLGKNSVYNPNVGYADRGFAFSLHGNELQAVKLHYMKEGFKWDDNPDPDPGHPCSAPYTTLSW